MILQKKIVRLITYKEGWRDASGALYHTPPLFYQLKILNINDLFILQISCFISDCLKKNVPKQFITWFTPSSHVHNYSTRSCTTSNLTLPNQLQSTNNLFVPYARTSYYGLRSLKIGGAKIWNNLPCQLRDLSSSRLCFKKALFTHLMSSYNPIIWSKLSPYQILCQEIYTCVGSVECVCVRMYIMFICTFFVGLTWIKNFFISPKWLSSLQGPLVF